MLSELKNISQKSDEVLAGSASQAEQDTPLNKEDINERYQNCNSGEWITVKEQTCESDNEEGREKSSSGHRNALKDGLAMYPSHQTSSKELHREACLKTKIHKCLVCGKGFLRLSRLRIHQLMHSEERSFPCEHCTKAFKFKSGLTRHKKKEHSGGAQGHLKTTCQEWHEQEQLLHVKVNLARPCRYCCELFPETILAYHMERCEKAKVHKCPECEIFFRKPSKLADHRRKHSDERPFSCDICAKSFKYKGGLNRHMKEQHSQREIEPTMVFSEREKHKNDLEYDARVTETWKEQRNSLQQQNLQQEENSCETEESSEFCREILGEVESNFELTSGARDISNKHFSTSNECDVSKPEICVYEESNLVENLVQKLKSFECNEIESEKLDHSHEEDKVHKCPEFEMVFRKPSALVDHTRKYSVERTFPCEICTKSFKYEGGLNRHMDEEHSQREMKPSMVFDERVELKNIFSLENGASRIKTWEDEGNNLEEENLQQERNTFGTLNIPEFCEESSEGGNDFELNSGPSDISNKHFVDSNERDLRQLEENNFQEDNLVQEQSRLEWDEIVNKKDDVMLCKESVERSEQDFELNSGTSYISSKHFANVKLPVFTKRCKKDKSYKCSDCEKVFKKPSALLIHKRKHSDERLFTCKICGKSFKYKGGVTRHLKEQHGEAKKILLKTTTLGRMDVLVSNKQEKKSSENEASHYREDILNYEKSNYVETDGRIVENTDNNSEEILAGDDAHSKQNSNASNFHNQTAPNGMLSLHTERGEKVNVHKCSNCEKIFRQRSKLLVHQLKHSDLRMFSCEICKKKFKHSWGKIRHMKKQHGQRTTNLRGAGSKTTRNEASNSPLAKKESINLNEEFANGSESCELEQVNHDEIDSNQVLRNFEKDLRNKETNSDSCEGGMNDVENGFELSSEQCPVLKEKFLTAIKSSLVHKSKRPKLYKCEDCEREFRRPSALVTHKRKHSNERLFSCNFCSTLFKHKWGLTRHLKKQHGQEKACRIDERQVNERSLSALDEVHIMNNSVDYNVTETYHYEENNFAEENFGKDFKSEEGNVESREDSSEFFKENLKKFGNNLELNCGPYEFPRESLPDTTLLDLLQRCQKAKFYKCLECGKVFRKSSALQSHQRKHSEQRLFACDICGKSFKHKGGVARHLKERHGQERNGECKMFDSRKENDKSCSLQGKDDQNSRAYNFESIVYEDAKDELENSVQERCNCETEKDDLKMEQDSLDGDNLQEVCFHIFGKQKIYKCPECPRAFLARSELREHKYKHTDIKSFPCRLCSKAFKFRSGLRRHNRKEHRNRLRNVQNSDEVCPVETQMLDSGEEMLERWERTNSCEELNKNVAENFVEMVNQNDVARNLPSKRDPSCSRPTIINSEPPLVKVSTKGINNNLSLKKPPVLYNCNKCDAKFKELCDFLTHQRIHK